MHPFFYFPAFYQMCAKIMLDVAFNGALTPKPTPKVKHD